MATSAVDWVTAVGTAGAALAATYAARKASQSTAASVDLVRIERERLDEEQRLRAVAELRAEAELIERMTWNVEVTNEGPAAARDVEVFIKVASAPHHQQTDQERLAPHESITGEASPHRGSSLRSDVTYLWTDSRGSHTRTMTMDR